MWRPRQYFPLAGPRRPRTQVVDALIIHEPVHRHQVGERLPGRHLFPVAQIVRPPHSKVIAVRLAPAVRGCVPLFKRPHSLVERSRALDRAICYRHPIRAAQRCASGGLRLARRRAGLNAQVRRLQHRRASLVVAHLRLRGRLEKVVRLFGFLGEPPLGHTVQRQVSELLLFQLKQVGSMLAQLSQARHLRQHDSLGQRGHACCPQPLEPSFPLQAHHAGDQARSRRLRLRLMPGCPCPRGGLDVCRVGRAERGYYPTPAQFTSPQPLSTVLTLGVLCGRQHDDVRAIRLAPPVPHQTEILRRTRSPEGHLDDVCVFVYDLDD
mmetsp:Transcript_36739/g.91504  ORF Transcript_36739/g.91504 Transcript_36739/m.91504 type:complete len:323 (+) Transcript_36739:669-1637(+)